MTLLAACFSFTLAICNELKRYRLRPIHSSMFANFFGAAGVVILGFAWLFAFVLSRRDPALGINAAIFFTGGIVAFIGAVVASRIDTVIRILREDRPGIQPPVTPDPIAPTTDPTQSDPTRRHGPGQQPEPGARKQYFIRSRGVERGPISGRELLRMYESGEVSGQDEVSIDTPGEAHTYGMLSEELPIIRGSLG